MLKPPPSEAKHIKIPENFCTQPQGRKTGKVCMSDQAVRQKFSGTQSGLTNRTGATNS